MRRGDTYDPFAEMHSFYSQDDSTEDEQFRFVEAMHYLLEDAWLDDDIVAFSYNLAIPLISCMNHAANRITFSCAGKYDTASIK